jgi:hypothetical protein
MDSGRSFSRKRTRTLPQDPRSKDNTDSTTNLAVSGINNIRGQRTPQSAGKYVYKEPCGVVDTVRLTNLANHLLPYSNS